MLRRSHRDGPEADGYVSSRVWKVIIALLLLTALAISPRLRAAAATPALRCGTRDPIGSAAPPLVLAPTSPAPPATSDHPVIDLMVLYTPAAMERCGGGPRLRSTVAGHVGYLNSAFAASGIAARVRLVRVEPIPWSGQVLTIAQELGTLADSTDVAAMRNQCGADLVCEVGSGFTDHPGIARLGGAFSVVDVADATVFAHEIGHNFGAMHDRPNTTMTTGFAYGFSFLVGRVRYGDIMSYTGLTIPLFSNPNRYWMGVQAGVAAEQPLAADNSRAIDAAARTVAAWRPTKTPSLFAPSLDSTSSFRFCLDIPDSLGGIWVVEYTNPEPDSGWYVLDVLELPPGTTTVTDDSVQDVPCRSYRARYVQAYNTYATSQVGFVRRTVPAGYSMLGVSLDPRDTRIAAIWPNPPDGLAVFTFDSGRQSYNVNFSDAGEWSQPEARIQPGQGMIIRNTGAETQFTQVGEAPSAFSLSLPPGFSLVCPPLPEGGAATANLGFPSGQDGDAIYRWRPDSASYAVCLRDGGGWTPCDPDLGVGEGFWVRKLSWSQGSDNNLWRKVLWISAP